MKRKGIPTDYLKGNITEFKWKMNTVRVPTVINLMPMSVMQMKNDARFLRLGTKKKYTS